MRKMKVSSLIAALALLPCMASASILEPPDTLGLHLYSIHSDSGRTDPRAWGWNNHNYGIYFRWREGLVVGTVKNSLRKQSYYIGWTLEDETKTFGLTLGLISGYDKRVSHGGYSTVRCDPKCERVQVKDVIRPMIVPSVRIGLDRLGMDHTSLRLSLLKAPSAPAALHLSVEYRF